MINTIPFANLVSDMLSSSAEAELYEKRLFNQQYFNRIRARIFPQTSRTEGRFAPDTISWLRLLSLDMNSEPEQHAKVSYIIPQIGITNRPLPGHKKAGLNFFKTLARISAPAKLTNFDQFTVEFEQRLPLNQKAFCEELYRQLSFLNSNKMKSRLIFYSHLTSNFAVQSDFAALRLSALKAIPVINFDWLDIDSDWDVIWNPCASLKSTRQTIETRLIKFLDQIIEQICPSKCDVLINDSSSFWQSTYIPYRDQYQLPKLNKIVSAVSLTEVLGKESSSRRT